MYALHAPHPFGYYIYEGCWLREDQLSVDFLPARFATYADADNLARITFKGRGVSVVSYPEQLVKRIKEHR